MRFGLIRKVAAPFVLALMVALAFTGCSKGEKEAEKTKAHHAVTADPAREHFGKGVKHMLEGKHDMAIEEFKKTVELSPDNVPAYNNLGFAYYDKGDLDRAIEYQKKALEIDPNFANAYYGLAQALEKKGDRKGAIRNWKEFLKRSDPNSKWHKMAQARLDALEAAK